MVQRAHQVALARLLAACAYLYGAVLCRGLGGQHRGAVRVQEGRLQRRAPRQVRRAPEMASLG
jgi:hypothetical protein